MGICLSSPKPEKVSEDSENDGIRYWLSSKLRWGSTMEDVHAAYLDLDSCTSFLAVYDCHEGIAVAKLCDNYLKYLHQQLLKHEAYSAGDLATCAQKAFLRMDKIIQGLIGSPRGGEVNDYFNDFPSENVSNFHGLTSGSSACVAIFIQNNRLLVANAGGSRCVLCSNGQAYDLSEDHKPDQKIEKDRILKHGRVNGILNLSRAIGDAYLKQNKSLPAKMQIVEFCDDDEFLVVACDEIWDCMSSQQLVDYVRELLKTERMLKVVCERVLDRCLAPSAGGEGRDNMTMMLVQFKNSIYVGAYVQ